MAKHKLKRTPEADLQRLRDFAAKWQAAIEKQQTYAEFLAENNFARRTTYDRRKRAEQQLKISLPGLIGCDMPGARGIEDVSRALHGWSPEHQMVHEVPEGFTVGGVSTLYRDDGSVAAQWVKSRQDPMARELLLKAAADALGAKIPREKPIKLQRDGEDTLLNAFVITDYHLGMLSWGEETGEDWDLTIAEDLLVAWMHRAILSSPPASTAILVQLGDFLHWDGLEALTPAHKNILDADTRFQKLVRVAIRVLRRVIAMLLIQHKNVHVILAEGNHDPASSVWMREWMHLLFEDEPRVTVDLSPDPYYCYQHGKTGLFFHHGHLSKIEKVDTVLAGKFRKVFGQVKHAYAHVGHRHSVDVRETPLMLVEQHRTLAAKDAYASRGGYLAGRDAQVISYHREHGEVGRVRISPEMVMGMKHHRPKKVHCTKFPSAEKKRP